MTEIHDLVKRNPDELTRKEFPIIVEYETGGMTYHTCYDEAIQYLERFK